MNAPGTVGAVVSGQPKVDAGSEARPDTFPAASYAATPRLYTVPHESPENAKEVDCVGPVSLPFRYTSYPATPTLSVDAAHDATMDEAVTAVATNDEGVDGGVESVAASAYADRYPSLYVVPVRHVGGSVASEVEKLVSEATAPWRSRKSRVPVPAGDKTAIQYVDPADIVAVVARRTSSHDLAAGEASVPWARSDDG